MQLILEKAIERYRRELILHKTNQAYAALREDIRSVSKLRFHSRLGAVDDAVMRRVEENVKILLGIF